MELPGATYLVVCCGAILIIIAFLSLYNILNPFSKFSSTQTSSNFEYIIFVSGEMSIALFIGYFIALVIHYGFNILGFPFLFFDKVAFITSAISFLLIYYRGKSHQKDLNSNIRS